MDKKLGTMSYRLPVHPCRRARGLVPVSRGCRERAGHQGRHWSWEPDGRGPGQHLLRVRSGEGTRGARTSGFLNPR